MLGVNPVYNAPADLRFGENLLKVRTRIHLSLYEDETAVLCHWHVPEAHFLEVWGDARALRWNGQYYPASYCSVVRRQIGV
jgi:molybdopterin-containing oxidoreductase family iron-sulfur binding subunit